MKMTNKQMDECTANLSMLMDKTKGKLGYAIAKNYRLMVEELKEYTALKDSAIAKYGETDEDGRIKIQIGTEAHRNFLDEMKEYDDIESDVNIIKLSPEEAYSSGLNSKEVLNLLFMIEDEA